MTSYEITREVSKENGARIMEQTPTATNLSSAGAGM